MEGRRQASNSCDCGFCGCVDQASVGLIQRWGRFDRLAEPGFHCFNPFAGQCLAAILTTRITSLDLNIDSKSKDNVFVEIECSVHYRVDRQNAADAFYEMSNPKQQIKAYVYDVVRAVVPTMNFIELFERKNEVAKSLSDELEKVMGPYGYTIERALVTNIVHILDPGVRKVLNEINAERSEKLFAKISAELDKVKKLFRASEIFYNNDTKRTLYVRIYDEKFSISYNELYAVFSAFGNLKNVAVLSSSDTFHSRVCFEHEEDAIRALKSLQGQDIYDGCCRMKIVLASEMNEQKSQDDLITMDEPEPAVSSVIGHVSSSQHVAKGEPSSASILGHGSSVQHIAHEKFLASEVNGQKSQDDLITLDEPEPTVSSVLGHIASSRHVAEGEPHSSSIIGHGSSVQHLAHQKLTPKAKLG